MSDRNHIFFGGPMSSGEYCVNVAGYDHKTFIPPSVCQRIADNLGSEWDVANRGTRLEIQSKRFFYGYRDDAKVLAAITSVIGEVVREGDVGAVKFGLPMIQVLDEDHHTSTGEIRFVKCAVLAENDNHWTVKPVEKPHYDPEATVDKNLRFDQALWRVSKTDGSAEAIAETFDISTLNDYVLQKISGSLEDLWRRTSRQARS